MVLTACAPAQATEAPPATTVPEPTAVPATSLPSSQEELDAALLDAISAEQVEDVQALLEAGANPNQEEAGMVLPFYRVAVVGNLEILELLLAHGGDLNAATSRGFGVLRFFTIEDELTEGQMAVAERIITQLIADGWDIDAYDSKGGTLLFWAAAGNQAQYVQLLIDLGADLDKPTQDNASPLMYASFTGQSDAVRVLLENGADVDYQGMFNHAALHVAAEGNHPEIVQMLIDAGADLDLLSVRELTPLGWALEKKNMEAAQVLQDAGASE